MEERLQIILSNVNEWLKFAEAKNAVLVAANAATIFGAAQIILGERALDVYMYWYLYLFMLFIASGAIFALCSFLPQVRLPWLTATGATYEHDNLIFYGDIAKYNPKDYVVALYNADGQAHVQPSTIDLDYAEQIVVNSRITLRKYEFFRYALWLTLSAVITPILAIVVYLLLVDRE